MFGRRRASLFSETFRSFDIFIDLVLVSTPFPLVAFPFFPPLLAFPSLASLTSGPAIGGVS